MDLGLGKASSTIVQAESVKARQSDPNFRALSSSNFPREQALRTVTAVEDD